MLYILIFILLSLLYKSNNITNNDSLSYDEVMKENLLSFNLMQSLNKGSVWNLYPSLLKSILNFSSILYSSSIFSMLSNFT